MQLCAARKFTPFTGLNKFEIQTRIPLIPPGVSGVPKMIAKIQLQIQDLAQSCTVKIYPVSHYSKTMEVNNRRDSVTFNTSLTSKMVKKSPRIAQTTKYL